MAFKKFCLFFFLLQTLFAKVQYEEPWGEDIQLIEKKTQTEKTTPSIGGKVANKIIEFYQHTITKASGPRSHFRPTSSKYMQLAIKRYGFLKGFIMGCDRLIRENADPWVYRTIEIDGIYYKFDPAFDLKKPQNKL